MADAGPTVREVRDRLSFRAWVALTRGLAGDLATEQDEPLATVVPRAAACWARDLAEWWYPCLANLAATEALRLLEEEVAPMVRGGARG